LLMCALTFATANLLFGRNASRGWLVGYATHLLCDQANAHLNPGRLYLWWPFKSYKMHTGPTSLSSSLSDFTPASLVLEGSLAALAFAAWLAERGVRRARYVPLCDRAHPEPAKRATTQLGGEE